MRWLPLVLPLSPAAVRRSWFVRAPSLSLSSGAHPRRWQKERAPLLFAELNSAVFDDELPADLPLHWSPRLRRTAGRCHFVTVGSARRARIELSTRVLDSPTRLQSTLAHEMCHAAQWLLDGVCKPPHGPAFQKWARQVEERVPGLNVTTRHSYSVFYRHRYSCVDCAATYGRHSHSLDVSKRICGHCGGSLRYEGTVGRDGAPSSPASSTPPFSAFVAVEYAPLRRRWPRVTHQRIMQELGRKWRRQKPTIEAKK